GKPSTTPSAPTHAFVRQNHTCIHLSSTQGPKRWTAVIVLLSQSWVSYNHKIEEKHKAMNYVAADVKKLRDETGATFADCKTALAESQTWEEALKFLEIKSGRKADKM